MVRGLMKLRGAALLVLGVLVGVSAMQEEEDMQMQEYVTDPQGHLANVRRLTDPNTPEGTTVSIISIDDVRVNENGKEGCVEKAYFLALRCGSNVGLVFLPASVASSSLFQSLVTYCKESQFPFDINFEELFGPRIGRGGETDTIAKRYYFTLADGIDALTGLTWEKFIEPIMSKFSVTEEEILEKCTTRGTAIDTDLSYMMPKYGGSVVFKSLAGCAITVTTGIFTLLGADLWWHSVRTNGVSKALATVRYTSLVMAMASLFSVWANPVDVKRTIHGYFLTLACFMNTVAIIPSALCSWIAMRNHPKFFGSTEDPPKEWGTFFKSHAFFKDNNGINRPSVANPKLTLLLSAGCAVTFLGYKGIDSEWNALLEHISIVLGHLAMSSTFMVWKKYFFQLNTRQPAPSNESDAEIERQIMDEFSKADLPVDTAELKTLEEHAESLSGEIKALEGRDILRSVASESDELEIVVEGEQTGTTKTTLANTGLSNPTPLPVEESISTPTVPESEPSTATSDVPKDGNPDDKKPRFLREESRIR